MDTLGIVDQPDYQVVAIPGSDLGRRLLGKSWTAASVATKCRQGNLPCVNVHDTVWWVWETARYHHV